MKFIFVIILIIGWVSCATVDPFEENTSTRDLTRVTAKFKFSSSHNASTRAAHFPDKESGVHYLDTALRDIVLLIYGDDGKICYRYSHDLTTGSDIDCSIENLSGDYFVRFIANVVGNLSGLDEIVYMSELDDLPVGPASGAMTGIDQPYVMLSEPIPIKLGGGDLHIDVLLKRVVSRIRFRYDNKIDKIDFIQLEKTSAQGRLFSYLKPDSHIIRDDSVGMGAQGEKMGFYYIYPSNEALKATIGINGIEKSFTMSQPLLFNHSYTLNISYSSPVFDIGLVDGEAVYDFDSKEFDVVSKGTSIVFAVGDNCTLTIDEKDAEWLHLKKNEEEAGEGYRVEIDKNTGVLRNAKIRVTNNLFPEYVSTFTILQRAAKYMVIAVGGQSNAVGLDESRVYINGIHAINPRAFQLSYRNGPADSLGIIPLTWFADNLSLIGTNNTSGLKGAKSICQPLANLILEKLSGTPYSDYDIMVIPVARGATAFTTGSTSTAYDQKRLRPSPLDLTCRWGKSSPYARTMIDRVKYMLDMNTDNKLLGFVWCQGEFDSKNCVAQNKLFVEMTETIFSQLSDYGSRCAKGVIDKDSWYVFTPPIFYSDWYSGNNVAQVNAGYKAWSPDTFVYIPLKNEYTNAVGGNGSTSSSRTSHYGNESYTNVVAPAVIECMSDNGSLFNGQTPVRDRFKDKTTVSQAQEQGGSMNDADISEGLLVNLPLNGTFFEELAGWVTVDVSPDMKLVATDGLFDINGRKRNTNALQLTAGGGGVVLNGMGTCESFSLSFLMKRTADLNADVQRVLTLCGEGDANYSYIGYRSYKNGYVSGHAEFMFEPRALDANRAKVIAGQFIEAGKVRSERDWIHFAVTYEASTRKAELYMNGELVRERVLSTASPVSFSKLVLGEREGVTDGVNAQLSNVLLWNKVIQNATVRKLFLMSYYGFEK